MISGRMNSQQRTEVPAWCTRFSGRATGAQYSRDGGRASQTRRSDVAKPRVFSRRVPGGRDGYAMLIVLIVILTTTAFAAVHQRQLSAALRVEQARMESEAFAQGPLAVLATAIDRLKTGDPPAPVEYSFTHTAGGTSTVYRVSYAVAGNQWAVTALPDSTASLLPTLPSNF